MVKKRSLKTIKNLRVRSKERTDLAYLRKFSKVELEDYENFFKRTTSLATYKKVLREK